MIIELHILQNFSPSCLNRDDLNAPKDCEFGGVRRARISSQCLKRATRWNGDFASRLENGIGTRTKLLRQELVNYFTAKGKNAEEATAVVDPFVSLIGSGLDENNDARTKIALYLGHDEIERIGAAIEARYDELAVAAGESPTEEAPDDKPGRKKKTKKGSGSDGAKKIAEEIYKSFQPGTKAADIALFGRMIAEGTNFNVNAAAQVAHAISTHSVPSEFDFFTAVDDLQGDADPGAGMMGSQQFNSATFYRYANVHMNLLGKNLGSDAGLTRAAALAFVHAFVSAIPSAKQNSHAALNPPDLVFALVRSGGQPLSLANAFAKPVPKNTKAGLIGESGKALADYWTRVSRAYLSESIVSAPFYHVAPELDEVSLAGGKNVESLSSLLSSVEQAIAGWTPEGSR